MASTRRRASHAHLPAHARQSRLKKQLVAAATGRTAKTAYAVIGTAGLAALAIAIFGPKRFEKEILKPAQGAISDQASQLWADSRPVREQIGRMFARIPNEAGRERLVKNFQSWVGHFRAT